MNARELSPREKLSAGRLAAGEKFPYFRTALVMMTPIFVAKGSLGTFGVTAQGVLLVDENALEEWNIEEISGVLVHEALHILRDHAGRFTTMNANPILWNYAADLEINDDLVGAKSKLPGKAMLPKDFNLEDGRTAEEYYAWLREKASKCPICGGKRKADPGNSNGGKDGQSSPDSSQGSAQGRRRKEKGCPFCDGNVKPQAGGGWCGSGAGRPVPGEPEIESQIKQCARSEAELSSIRRQVAEAIRRHSEKSQGSIPGGLLRWAEDLLRPPQINWRAKLAQTIRMAIAYRPGAIDFRYGRPSRRQSVMGHGLGHPVLPAMQRPVPNVGIAIDTSGSMSAEDLTLAVSEAKGILEAVGAELTFIACDAEVRAIKVVNDTSSLVRSLVGGGGTDFNPVFKAVQTIRPRPEVLIFATDGWGPAPDKPPRGIRVVWLLIGEQGRPPEFPGEPWGEMVKVEESEKDGEDKAA